MKTQKSLARYGIASKKTGGSIRGIADFTGVTARFAQICLAFSSPSEKSGLTLQIRSMDRRDRQYSSQEVHADNGSLFLTGVLAYCRSFVPNEKTIHQDRGRDPRLGQPSYKNSQPLRARLMWGSLHEFFLTLPTGRVEHQR
jgi:hypothetical protein